MAKEMTMRVRWEGEPPRVGHFLKTQKGRNAYEIASVRETGGEYNLRLKVNRWAASDVPGEATVHFFKWDSRKKRR